MPNAWIFQANPDHYDIDAALKEIDEIHWRVPQHTYGIHAGDDVLIWRSGAEAGVVGVGKTMGPPQMSDLQAKEERYYRSEEDRQKYGLTTRVPIRVTEIPYLPKNQFREIGDLEMHQIVTAPMGTVFPLSRVHWDAVIDVRPEAEAFADLEVEPEKHALPRPFAWEDRRKSVYPLPGGYDSFVASLIEIMTRVRELRPDRSDLEDWLQEHFGVSETSARFAVGFLERASLLSVGANAVEPTSEGAHWLKTEDSIYLIGLIHSRIRFIGEMLALLEEGARSVDELLELANARYGMGWKSRAQIDRRRGWLQSTGMIEVDEEGRWQLTDRGRQLLRSVELADERPRSSQEPEEEGPEEVPDEDRPPTVSRSPGTRRSRAQEIQDELEAAAHDSSDPDRFEKAVADAFSFLGFESKWLGGSGKTDVLVIAELGPDEGFRAIVDCKTTGREAVRDHQIDWITLAEHRRDHRADYVAVVGPSFAGSRLKERAGKQSVTVIDVGTLGSMVVQHAEVPLGLDVYQRLFSATDGAEGAAEIGELAEETDRRANLAAAIVRVLRREEATEGPLSSTDLYWLLRDHSDELGDVTRGEIRATMQGLALPGIGILRPVEGGYCTIGSLESAAARLAILAEMIAGNVTVRPDATTEDRDGRQS